MVGFLGANSIVCCIHLMGNMVNEEWISGIIMIII